MTFPHIFLSRVRSYFRRSEEENRLEEELRSHREMLVEEYRAAGMPEDEARRAARRALGGIEQVKEAHRDQRRFAFVSNTGQDLRYAVRQLRKAPGFFALMILILAVGIGVNAAMFTVIDQTLLRRLPYPDANRLVKMEAARAVTDSFSYSDVKAWRERDRDFSNIAYSSGGFAVNVDEAAGDGLVYKYNVSANLFPTLGVRPILGRSFQEIEQEPGRSNELVISDGFWRSRLHSSQPILGKKLRVGGQIYTVIGVMPHGFAFPADTREQNEIWAPLALDAEVVQKNFWFLTPIARLKQGVSLRQAAQDLNALQQQLHKEDSQRYDGATLKLTRYRETLTMRVRPALEALAAAVAMVWLITCANVAGLMLTRIQGRRRELSIRAALGAGRTRLVSQLLTESVLMSALGGLLGLGLSQATTAVLGRAIQAHLPVFADLHVSWTVLAALFGGVLLSAVVIGIIPALQAASTPAHEGLQEGSARAGIGRRQRRLRDGFVVAQVALSFVTLVSAGLMLRTLYSLHRVPLGFQPEHIIATSLFLPPHQYEEKDVTAALYQPLLEKLRETPGVEAAGLTSVLPVQPSFSSNATFVFADRPKPERGHEPQAALRFVSPNIFSLLRVPLLQGRLFSRFDSKDGQAVAVVNRSFVQAYFPHESPLGKYIRITEQGSFAKTMIVGVVGDVHQSTLNAAPAPEIDLSIAQVKPSDGFYGLLTMFMQVVVRTYKDPQAMVPTIRHVLQEINPDLALNRFTTMQQSIDNSFGSQTLAGRLLGLFGCVALLIAAAGLYALLAYAVSQRTHEIGVRIALGAQPSEIFWMILRHAGAVASIGVVLGLGGAWLAGDVLRSYLYGVGGHDGLTIIAVGIVLVSACLIAAYVPARRAASVDPVIALRHE